MFYVNLMVTTRGKPTRDSQKIKERNSKHNTIENHQKEGSKRRGGEGSGTLLQYSCLENPMDGGAWWATVHGVTKSRTRLSDFIFTFHFHALEKEMATHSSVLAWRIPGTGEPGGLPSMRSHRVGHNWSDLAAAAAREEEKKGTYKTISKRVLVSSDLSIIALTVNWLNSSIKSCRVDGEKKTRLKYMLSTRESLQL